MSLIIPAPQRRHPSPEELAWEALYRSANDPARASEVVDYFEMDPQLQKAHLALYLRCRQTVRVAEIRQYRTERAAAVVRWVLLCGFVMPMRALMEAFRRGRDVALEIPPALPATAAKKEPAAKRVRKLVRASPEIARAHAGFAGSQAPTPSATPGVEPVVVDGLGAEAFSEVRPARTA